MHVARLSRYPVKSLQGEELEQAHVDGRGVLGDRGWALVDAQDGTVASAKHPRKWGRLLELSARYVDEPLPGEALPPVVVALPDGRELVAGAPGTDAALSAFVGRDVRLTDERPDGGRFEEQWPGIEGLAPAEFIAGTTTSHEDGDPVSTIDLGLLAPPGTFFDLAPLHLLTTSTLAALSELAPGAGYAPARYRPNLLLEEAGPGFAEDEWVGRSVTAGDAVLTVSMLTMRCVMTTLAQPGLPVDPATLRGIARHHRREIPGLGTWACAGVYAGVGTPGVVRRGDAVTLA